MQPADKRRNKNQTGISRARMLLKKNMGWLPGYPLMSAGHSVRWCVLLNNSLASEVIALDREHLRRMQSTLTKLRHKFPRALPKIVDDVDDWLARMDFLLASLKETIHEGRTFNSRGWPGKLSGRVRSRFQEIRQQHPCLEPLLDAAFALEFTSRHTPSLDSFEWIDEHAADLSKLGAVDELKDCPSSLDLQLMFYLLRDDMRPELQRTLVNCFSDERFWSMPIKNVRGFALDIEKELTNLIDGRSFEIPQRKPTRSLAESLRQLLVAISQMKSKHRRSVMELFDRLFMEQVLGKLGELHDAAEAEASRLFKLLRRLDMNEAKRPQTNRQKKQFRKEIHLALDDCDELLLDHLRFAIESLLQFHDRESDIKLWVRFLSGLPQDDFPTRLGLFKRWEEVFFRGRRQIDKRHRQNFRFIVKQLTDLNNRREVHPVLMSHWRQCALSKRSYVSEFVCQTASETASKDEHRRTIQLLEKTVYQRGVEVEPDLLGSFVEFAKANTGRAVDLITNLAQYNDALYVEDEISAVLSITHDDARAAEILHILDKDYELVEPVKTLSANTRGERIRRVVERLVLERDKKTLLRLAAPTQVVAHVNSTVPELVDLSPATDWLSQYPTELNDALSDLCQAAEDAETIAEKLLSRDFPKKSQLRHEIDSIEEKLNQSEDADLRQRLQIRLNNLNDRLSNPPQIKARRLAKLREKIRTRADHEFISRYLEMCNQIAAATMQAEFNLGQLPEKLFTPPHDQLLSGIMQLNDTTRELGLRLLLQSHRDPMADFYSAEQNVAFLQKLESSGINLQPWLDSSIESFAKTSNGESYRLSFTHDVLDYLMMGFHFGTCLSPGDFNFFSTIANAVDVNKQVVYGKTNSGRIIGRCLFTLTDKGSILTYHRYFHDPTDKFADAVDDFAARLAAAMKTTLGPIEKISTLVATSWYDDGAMPHNNSELNLHAPNSPVRQLFETASPKTLIDDLQKLLGPDFELKSILGQILHLEELSSRREIIEPFIGLYGFDSSVPFNERLRIAILAHAAQMDRPASEIIFALQPNRIVARLKRFDCEACDAFHGVGSYREVFDLLTDYNPTIALRTIRATRSRSVRDDLEERNRQRRSALAKIHTLLGREQLAAKLGK